MVLNIFHYDITKFHISLLRVADYGFTKLLELFEAVPGTVEVTEDADGERLLQLTDSERLSVVGDHVSQLINSAPQKVISNTC